MSDLFEWIRANHGLLWWLAGASLLMFVGSLILVPVVVARIPTDYFAHKRRPHSIWAVRHCALRVVLLIAKNAVGLLLLVAGIAMLVLPGQGVLSILMGIILLNFPGKFRLERWLVRRRPVIRSINWLRRRANRDPLDL